MLDDNTSTSQPSINGPGIGEDSCRGIVQKIEHINPWRIAVHCIVHSSFDCSCKIWNCTFIVTMMNCNLEKESVTFYQLFKMISYK